MGQKLADTMPWLRGRYSRLIVSFWALTSALFAMALPGPASSLTGYSSILVIGALALMAGHAWGLVIIGAAEVFVLGVTWPLVLGPLVLEPLGLAASTSSAELSWIAVACATTALPGLVVFVRSLPALVEFVLGETDSYMQGPGEFLSAGAAALWLLSPLAI